jgi:hypothetical protein
MIRFHRLPSALGIVALSALALTACGGAKRVGANQTTQDGSPTSAAPAVVTPPGLPKDWSNLAIRAATTTLTNCAQANSSDPANCPQQDSNAGGTTVDVVHWTLLNQPLANAVAVPAAQQGQGTSAGGSVDVYGLYQMDVSDTVSGQGIRPYLAYSGGIAHATMTWDGSSFQNVTFSSGPLDQLPSGVTVAPFGRPGQATDASVLAAVKAGFQDCLTLQFPPTNPDIPNCPQQSSTHLDATSAQWSQNSDPMQGALVSFDTQHGDFAVTGSFDMNLNYVVNTPGDPGAAANGPHTNHVAGSYTATVVWDGSKVQLLNIALS